MAFITRSRKYTMKTLRIKHGIKTFLLLVIFTTTLTSCSTYTNKDKPIIGKERKEAQTFTFIDKEKDAEIKLKLIKYSAYADEVNLAYIISINSSLSWSSRSVYLSFLDSDGFEIKKLFIGNVAGLYTGLLKGTITISTKKYKKIAGAELVLFREK